VPRHFAHLSEAELAGLFHRQPEPLAVDAPADLLGVALGATLYTPGSRDDLADVALRQAARGVVSMVFDLEDAVADDDVSSAQANLVLQLRKLAQHSAEDRPLVFARVRRPEQLADIAADLGDDLPALSGFVLPKFDEVIGPDYLAALHQVRQATGVPLWAMPVLETPGVMFAERRQPTLLAVRDLLDRYREAVLTVRIGATDLCGLLGLRRDREFTIYDIRPVSDAIGDIVNILGREDGTGFLVSGPVWEYFDNHERLFKPQLRTTPFERRQRLAMRRRIVTADLDRLIREVMLDKANGLTGKTVIHPSHVPAVHAMAVVTHEEFVDACDIADSRQGGVKPSGYRNKMNESKPHQAWAARTLRRAQVFGVLKEGCTFVDVLATGVR
jgi:citrate lyase beta subunit